MKDVSTFLSLLSAAKAESDSGLKKKHPRSDWLMSASQACLTDQLSSSRLMLDKMSREKIELEDRLSDMLSRIAMETQEIKELEQQLTDSKKPTDQS